MPKCSGEMARPASAAARLDDGPPGDGVVERDAAGQPAVGEPADPGQRLRAPGRRATPRAGPGAGASRASSPSTSSPDHQRRIRGQVLVEPRRAVTVGQSLGGPLGGVVQRRRRTSAAAGRRTAGRAGRAPWPAAYGLRPGRHEVGAELEAADAGGGVGEADERVDAAGEERLGQPDRVEAEVVELVDDVAELARSAASPALRRRPRCAPSSELCLAPGGLPCGDERCALRADARHGRTRRSGPSRSTWPRWATPASSGRSTRPACAGRSTSGRSSAPSAASTPTSASSPTARCTSSTPTAASSTSTRPPSSTSRPATTRGWSATSRPCSSRSTSRPTTTVRLGVPEEHVHE